MTGFSLSHRPSATRATSAIVGRVWHDLQHVIALQRTRHILAQMDDRALADIGISRHDVGYGVDAPIWDAGLR